MAKKIEDLYREQVQLIEKARNLLEKEGELNDTDKAQINAFISQADDCEKRAKQLTALLEKQTAAEADAAQEKMSAQKADQSARSDKAGFGKEKTRAGFDKGFYEFLLAVADAAKGRKVDPRLEPLETKALSGNTGSAGGYLLPTQYEAEVLQVRGEVAMIRPVARVVPMAARTVDFPRVKQTAGSAGVSGFYGGVVVYYVDDNDTITESSPTFGAVKLEARDVAGYALIPNSLLRDSPVSLEAYLSGPGSFGGALGWREDYDFLRGSGSGRPLGMLNAPCRTTVTRNTATNFKFVDVVTMKSKMLLTGGARMWVMNQSVMPKLYQMQGGNSENIWVVNAANGAPETLLGDPVKWTEKTPVLGTEGDVAYLDPSMYLVGDRQVLTVDVSREEKFQKNQTAFRIVQAIEGQPWLEAAITLADGATVVSPFVILS